MKAPGWLGLHALESQHLHIHMDKCRALGRPLEVAIAVGAPPAAGACAAAKIPYGVDEMAVAGALAGEPLEMAHCETVDLDVPAASEIVIEGVVDPDRLEAEGPHGESRGYMFERCWAYAFAPTCISHRRNPIVQVFLSQYPPSESSLIRRVSNEAMALGLLRNQLGVRCVRDVAFPESVGAYDICVVRLASPKRDEVWRALYGIAALLRLGKIAIAVDEDIDPHDADSVYFALATRMQPHRDVQIIQGKTVAAEMVAGPTWADLPTPRLSSGMLIDATMKWPLPPTALPGKDYMEKALELWNELGLPPLAPRRPWFGSPLGFWSTEHDAEARQAAEGRYFEIGEKLRRMTARHGEVGDNSTVEAPPEGALKGYPWRNPWDTT